MIVVNNFSVISFTKSNFVLAVSAARAMVMVAASAGFDDVVVAEALGVGAEVDVA